MSTHEDMSKVVWIGLFSYGKTTVFTLLFILNFDENIVAICSDMNNNGVENVVYKVRYLY